MRFVCATLFGIAVFCVAEAWWKPGRFCTGAFAPHEYTIKIGHSEFGLKNYNMLSMFGRRPLFPIDVRSTVLVAGPYVRVHFGHVLAWLFGATGAMAVWFGWHLLPPRHYRQRQQSCARS